MNAFWNYCDRHWINTNRVTVLYFPDILAQLDVNEKSISLRDWRIGLAFSSDRWEVPRDTTHFGNPVESAWKKVDVSMTITKRPSKRVEASEINSASDSCVYPIRRAVPRTFMIGLKNKCHDEVRASQVMFVIWTVVADRTTLCIVICGASVTPSQRTRKNKSLLLLR